LSTTADTITGPPVQPTTDKRSAARLLIWCVVCLATPLLLLRESPSPEEVPVAEAGGGRRSASADSLDVRAVIEELRQAKPDYIGIGNSMMFTRLGKKPDEISALTGRKFFLITKGGTDTPAWYLTLKNVVAASGVRPKAVFLFIRDNELTTPYFGNDKESPVYLQSLRGEHEPELDSYMMKSRSESGSAMTGKVSRWLDELYSFPGWQERMSRHMMDTAMDVGGFGATKKAQRFALSARFGLDHLRGDVPADMADDLNLMTSSYKETTESSLLPEMMRVAKECGTRLLFFRVKRRPDAKTHLPEEPEAMRDYADFLKGWLAEREGIFFDETYDESIRLTDYLDGDHIRPERQEWYRDYFWKRMKGVFP